MSVIDDTLNIVPTAELFQKKLRRLLVNNESPEAQSLLRKPEYQAALFDNTANTWKSYYRELNAYVDAANVLNPPVVPSSADPASKKQSSLKPALVPTKKGDLPSQGNGASRKTTGTNGDSKGTPPSSNTSPKKSPASGTKTPKEPAQKPHRNWWNISWLDKHKHKS